MKKRFILLAAMAAALHAPALWAQGPAQTPAQNRTLSMQIDGQDMRVANAAGRLLGNEERNGPHLVEDITDGQGAQKVPGYKLQVMARTYSTLAEARAPREGQQRWGDDMRIHRGVKLVLGIPVQNGQMNLADARLLNMAVVSDAGASAFNPETDKVRPRGEQLVKKETSVSAPELQLTELSLPDFAAGQRGGGAIKVQAAATLDGKRVQARMDTRFDQFQVVPPRAERAFASDARFAAKP